MTQIEVEIVQRRPDGLALHFLIIGRMSEVLLSPAASGTRADGLWHHTCFEAFLQSSSGTAYYELNFAPSTQWAAFGFTSYRSGKHDVLEIDALPISIRAETDSFRLKTEIALERLCKPNRLGLSAVIEEASGQKSFWALAHPSDKPDFHRPECFIHELWSRAPA